jgi:hypothetical protein
VWWGIAAAAPTLLLVASPEIVTGMMITFWVAACTALMQCAACSGFIEGYVAMCW